MVSVDHFAHELRAQLKKVEARGSIDIVINSGQLYRSHMGCRHAVMPCAVR
jgi:hypothetical protein